MTSSASTSSSDDIDLARETISVVLNARSGTAVPEEELREAFDQHGVDITIVNLDGEADAERLREAAVSSTVLVAAGGDGTISSVASAIVKSGARAVLGVMPLGTCNDLSRTLGIPAGVSESAAIVLTGRDAQVDVVELDGDEIMINQANGGFGGEVRQEVEGGPRERWGPLAYWRASIQALQGFPEFEVDLLVDGEHLSLQALNLTVANARYSGCGIPVAPEARMDDGLMDLVVVEGRMRLGLVTLVPRFLSGTQLNADGVLFRRARRIEMLSRPSMPFSVDGEFWPENPHRFQILPSALRVRVPRG